MAKMGEEEVDYESDLEEEKRPLGLRRREAASDDEEVDGELEKKRLGGLDRRAPIHSDDGSDDQLGAAEYDDDEDEEEEEPLDGGEVYEEEEEEEVEEEEDGYVVGKERDDGEEVEGLHRQKEQNEIPVRGEAGEVEGDDRDMEGGDLEEGLEDREEDGENAGEEGDEEEKKENEPFAVPTAGAFYMHDDRFRESSGGRNRRTYGGRKLWESKDDKKWGHDKFEEMTSQERLHHDQGRRNSGGGYRGRGGRGRGPEQGYGRRSNPGSFSNGNSQSQGPKSVRGRGPRKYEPNWKNSNPASSLQNKRPVEKNSHGGSGRAATVMSNPESEQVPLARKHSSLNSASPPFYPSGSSSKDVTVPQKNDPQSGSASRNNVQQTGALARGRNVSGTVGIDKLYIDDRATLVSGKALNNVQMPQASSSSMVNNFSQTSQTRAQGRSVPVSGQVGYQSPAPHNQVNRNSPAPQHHVAQRGVAQGRGQSAAQAPSQQSSQRSGGGSRASSPPNSAMSESSYEHGEAESTSESGKSRSALVGKGKGPFLYGGAQVVATSGGMGVVPGDQNFPARPTFLPVMQFGGQHPGGMGVPALGMAFPGYVAQHQHGLGNSEMAWLPVLTGAAGALGSAGALGAAYCPPYLTVDGSSYHALPAGQSSSMSSSSKETNTSKSNNELKPSQRPEAAGDEYGQRQKPRRYSEMDFKQPSTST